MPSRSRCSICRRDDAPAINAALDLGWGYRWIRDRYAVSLGALSRHTNHRQSFSDEEPLDLEQRVDQLAEDVAQLRLVVENELQALRSAQEILVGEELMDSEFFSSLLGSDDGGAL